MREGKGEEGGRREGGREGGRKEGGRFETHLEERVDLANVSLVLSVIIFHLLHCHIWTSGDHTCKFICTCMV